MGSAMMPKPALHARAVLALTKWAIAHRSPSSAQGQAGAPMPRGCHQPARRTVL